MGKALYRKYRSKSFDEIVGQSHITTTLKNALKSGAISHAYLFTGPRGTGKTSIARIIAHAVNDLSYDDIDTNHLDIIEIDAASNRRIDEIRELRERVHIAPTSAKYKVYIIDEVHMLTKEAFNALLKTLEEPPEHVIFILATTEIHKLPETIISRTQRFTLKPVEQTAVVQHLKHIAKQEGLSIEDDALRLIADHGGGSFRDSISMLDQVRGHNDKVTLSDVESMLGIAPDKQVGELYALLRSGSAGDIVTVLSTMKEAGYHAGQIAKQLSATIRQELLSGTSTLPSEQLTQLLQKLLDVPAATDQMAALELALLAITLRNNPTAITKPVVTEERPETVTENNTEPTMFSGPVQSQATEEKKQVSPEKEKSTNASILPMDSSIWDEALATIKQTHNTLYSVARMAVPTIKDDELTLTFSFAFHQKRLNENKNKQVLIDILHTVAGRPIAVVCLVGKTEAAVKELAIEPPVAASISSDTISTISNIFGGAELLES